MQKPSFPIQPRRPEPGMLKEQTNRVLEFVEEGKRPRRVCLITVELRCIPKVATSFGMQRVCHENSALS